MASGSDKGATGQGSDSGHNSVGGRNIASTPSDDNAVRMGVAVYNSGQHQVSKWTGCEGHYSEKKGSMTAATKQAQHDPHWIGNRFITGGHGEELDHPRRPMEPSSTLQASTKDPCVVIHTSVLVPNEFSVPRALLPTASEKSCCQLVVRVSLGERRQQNEHCLLNQAEREEVSLFRATQLV